MKLNNIAIVSYHTKIRHCHICNFTSSVSCNNEIKLKVTFQFPLAKGNFN